MTSTETETEIIPLASTPGNRPDPEVPEQAKRRSYPAAYKLQILEEADRCTEPGEMGSLLRREGLYASLLSNWRKQRETGTLAALSPRKRGRKPGLTNPLSNQVEELKKENAKLRQKLAQAETIIEIQKKISGLLGIPLNPDATIGII